MQSHELFSHINKAFRDKNPVGMKLWKPVAWHIAAAQKALTPAPGVYFRGIGKLLSYVKLPMYTPGNEIMWAGFTSSSSDLRIADKFMYGSQKADKVEGVIFKIWSKTPAPIMWCSFVPSEQEYLFAPDTKFKVLNWYEATETNLRSGLKTGQYSACKDFLLSCDSIVRPVPLPTSQKNEGVRKDETSEQRQTREEKWLYDILAHQADKVLLIEMQELEVPRQNEDGDSDDEDDDNVMLESAIGASASQRGGIGSAKR